MCRKSVCSYLLVCVLGLAWAGISEAADPSLVGWWKLDDGTGTVATDSSGNGNHGNLVGTTEWVEGIIGGALHLDGATALVDIPASNSLAVINKGDFACMVWLKTDALDAANQYALQQADLNGPGRSWLFIAGDNEFRTFVGNGTTGSGVYAEAETWYHVGFVVTEGGTTDTIQMYVNGQPAGAAGQRGMETCEGALIVGSHKNLAAGTRWTGVLDDLRLYNRALTAEEIQTVMKGTPELAADPVPADKQTDILRDAALSWTPGELAATHDVYFGTAFDDVNDAGRANPMGVLVSQDQMETSFEPADLEYGQTYYWRIDEVNTAAATAVFKGSVWSFTVEPFAYPVQPIAATASSFQTGMGPENTINGVGLDADDRHSTEETAMWLSDGTGANWIRYEFDRAYKLNELLVWNSNQLIEAFLGFGAKDVTIEYSLDGETWTVLDGVPEFAQATGLAAYTANTTVDLGGITARYVKLTINSNWGGITPQTGLSAVRFFQIPVRAREPMPADGAANVSVAAELNWRPGREATSHEVFFGTDAAAVADGTVAGKTVTVHSYAPDALNYGTTYFWKIDEVGDGGTYEGAVWSFSTEPYAIVDDFESYDDDVDAETTIWHAWIDGLTDGKSGSQVGYDVSPFAEKTIVHGGKQAMPFKYDNSSFAFSEAKLTFDSAQDWTARGIKSLSLYFAGTVGNGGKLYIKINNTKVLFDGDPADLARGGWHTWNIDLSKAGNVGSVRSLTIGVEGAGASGMLYIDDIRLYPKALEYITPVQPAAADLVAHYTFDEGAGTKVGDSSGKGHHGTVNGTPQWAAGKIGGAMAFSGVTTEYVEAPEDPAVTGTHSRTVAAWIKTTTYGEIASWGQNVAGQKWVFRVQESNGTLGAIRIEVNGGYQVGSTDVRDDEWHHAAAVLPDDGSPDVIEIALYVDGVLEANSAQLDEPINTAAGVVRIGLSPWNNRPFTGLIDDVRIYSRPLSAEEMAGLAGRTIPIHKPF